MTRLLSIAVTTLVAAFGGWIASLIGFPLPWLLGALVATGLFTMSGITILGELPRFPVWTRNVAVPVIGVMIGAVVPPDILGRMGAWWPSLLMVIPFVISLQMLNYVFYRRIGGYDRPTAFFSASPGGLIEAVLLGERMGGNVALLSIQHLGRVSLTVAFIPLLFLITTGESVGSAAGITTGPGTVAAFSDYVLLILAGVVGLFTGRLLRLPAAPVLGPMVASAILHATEITTAGVPGIVVQVAQLVVGTGIGMRFLGQNRRAILHGLGLSLLVVSFSIGFAFLTALAVHQLGIADIQALFLAFAPGGLAEMGLVAISLGASPMFVALHHILRIVLTIFFARQIFWLMDWRDRRRVQHRD